METHTSVWTKSTPRDGFPGIVGQFLDVGLAVAAELDRVVHAARTAAVSAIDSLCPSWEPDGSR